MIIENNGHWRNKHCIHGQPHDNVTPFCRKINQWCEIPWKVCNSIDELHCETQNLCRMLARLGKHDTRNNGHWRNKYCFHGQPHVNENPICREINQWCEIVWKVCNTSDELQHETQKLCRMSARFRDTW